MTTEPADLREKIKDAIPLTPYQRGRVSREVGQVAQSLARREMQADNVLAIVREAQAEAWDDCSDTAGDYLAGGSVRAAMDLAEMNPYRERSTDDE